jgi:phage tail sheath gpL-like
MSSKVRIDLTIPVNSATYIAKTLPINTDSRRSFDGVSMYMAAMAGGVYSGTVTENIGVTNATGTLTISSTGPTAGQSFTVGNVTFTAETSGATGNQFNINASPTIVASNIAVAVNASPNTIDMVTATSSGGVVTFTAHPAGNTGNGMELSAGTLSNAVASGFSGGSTPTTYTWSNGGFAATI